MASPNTSDLGYQSPSVAQMREEMRNFNPVANARQTLSSAWENLKSVPGNIQRLATDPAQYLKDLPDPTEDQLLNALSPGNVGMAGIMIGPRARTWNAGNATKAEAMEKAGHPPEKIWQDTGTYRGPDGAWRQEINDQPAQFQFKGDLKAKARAAQSEIDAMKAQIKESLAREKEVKADLFPKEAVAARKAIKGQATTKSEALNDIHGLASDPQYTGNYLKHAYEHPELYAAYPELQQYVMRQGADAGPGALGSLAGQNVNVYKYGLTRNPKKTTTHEMQHAIQQLEDTPRGSSPNEFWNARQMARDHIIDHNTELTRINDLMNKAGTPEEVAALQARYQSTMAERDALTPYARTDPFQEYQRSGGEAEARMAENRMEMSPAERAATYPMKSYGQYEPSGLPVDPSDLIMIKHGEMVKPGYAAGGTIRLAKGGRTGDIDEMKLALMNKAKFLAESKVKDVLYRGGVGHKELAKEFLEGKSRPGYATFASTSPHVAGSYANTHEDNEETVGGIVPLHINVHTLHEFPVTTERNGARKFDKFAFDKHAKTLEPGHALVARQVYDQGPRASMKTDPKMLYSYPSDIYAWTNGTETKSALSKAKGGTVKDYITITERPL